MIDLRALILLAFACVCLLGCSSATPSLQRRHYGLPKTLKAEVKKTSRALTQDNSDDLSNAAMAFLWAFPLVNSKSRGRRMGCIIA